ncbi:MAG: outer membrane beta-barrel protein, partial [Brumimicrobium sp.]|nr:outer membrane beta-barrel protein [Brumimicrobium sp.]
VSQNLVDEPPALRQIYEANIGVRLAAKQDLWLDVGVMESNLGFESVIGANCWMMTRSILAESSPYYLSAAKLNYQTRNEKWLFAFLFSNGWQRMVNGYPSLGHQVKWHPNKRWTINSSSFIGKVNISNNQTGFIPTVQQRYFHNFFFKYEAGRIGVIASLDAGLDHSENNTDKFSIWMGSALLLRYRFNTKFALAARGTLYSDNNSHNVVSKDFNDFMNFGFSLNLDHQITNNVLWRVEGKRFESRNPIYLYKGNPAHFNYYIGTALTFRIGEF